MNLAAIFLSLSLILIFKSPYNLSYSPHVILAQGIATIP